MPNTAYQSYTQVQKKIRSVVSMLVRIINLQQKDNKAVMNSCADNDGHLTKVEQVACPFIV